MKKFNYKSRKGFTLIELLVVIGILAVLAAIAIPSVAGLIDRANVSADDTNANEMTNAIERFTSEYELFCQDIASGRFNPNDLDSAQSRVYNVTGADSREDITLLEGSGLSGKKINRDTKYPENIATTKAIVENYTKTSSATYEPKQSDMNFYYSPDCGVVVFSEATDEPNVEELNKLIISGKDAKGKTLNGNTVWINLTTGTVTDVLTTEKYNHNGNVIPEGATYQIEGGELLVAGKPFPTEIKTGDEYNFGDYIYKFNYECYYNSSTHKYLFTKINSNKIVNGWGAMLKDRTKVSYSPILHSINGADITDTKLLFSDCTNLKTLSNDFAMPTKAKDFRRFFYNCDSLETIPSNVYIPSSVETAFECFAHCDNLTTIPSSFYIEEGIRNLSSMFRWCFTLNNISNNFKIPNTVTDLSNFFSACYELKTLPNGFTIPDSVVDLNCMFALCNELVSLPDSFNIPPNATNISGLFDGCKKLTKISNNFTIPATATNLNIVFCNCRSLTGTIYILSSPTNDYQCFDYIRGPLKIYGVDEDFLLRWADDECITYELIN